MKKALIIAVLLIMNISVFSCKEEVVYVVGKPGEPGDPGDSGGTSNKTETPEQCVLATEYVDNGVKYTAIMFRTVDKAEKYSFYVIGYANVPSYITTAEFRDAPGKTGRDILESEGIVKTITETRGCNRIIFLRKTGFGVDVYDNINKWGVQIQAQGKEYSDIKWTEYISPEQREKY